MQSGAIKEATLHQHVQVGAHLCLALPETFDIKDLSNLPKDLNCRLVESLESLGIKELKERWLPRPSTRVSFGKRSRGERPLVSAYSFECSTKYRDTCTSVQWPLVGRHPSWTTLRSPGNMPPYFCRRERQTVGSNDSVRD